MPAGSDAPAGASLSTTLHRVAACQQHSLTPGCTHAEFVVSLVYVFFEVKAGHSDLSEFWCAQPRAAGRFAVWCVGRVQHIPAIFADTWWCCPELYVPLAHWARKYPPWRARARIRDAHLLLGESEKPLLLPLSTQNSKDFLVRSQNRERNLHLRYQKSRSGKTNQLQE